LRRFLLFLMPLLALPPIGCADLRLDPVATAGDGSAGGGDMVTRPAAGPDAAGRDGGAGSPDATEAGMTPPMPPGMPPPPDAGPSPDAAAPDRAPDRPAGSTGPAPSRCPPGAYICDGFEKAEIDPAQWYGFAEAGAAYSIDRTHAARGAQALRLHVNAMSTEPVGITSGPLAERPLPNPIWVRFFVFLPDDVPPFDGAFVTLDNPRKEAVWVDWWDGGMKLSGRVERVAEVAGVPAHGRWVCIVVKQQTAGGNELSVFLDGSNTPTLTSPLDGSPVFQRLMFAISPDGTHPRPLDLWIDEVLVSPSPVSCED
jgi:hypothetical protein